MKLRRLLLLPSNEDERTSDSTPEGEKGPDWDLLAEVDGLRTTSSGGQSLAYQPRTATINARQPNACICPFRCCPTTGSSSRMPCDFLRWRSRERLS